MVATRTQRLTIPVAEDTVLLIRESCAWARTFYLYNVGTGTLSCQWQKQIGSTWSDIGSSFDIGPKGGGDDVVVSTITDTEPLRLLASGGSGGTSKELEVTYCVFFDESVTEWASIVM